MSGFTKIIWRIPEGGEFDPYMIAMHGATVVVEGLSVESTFPNDLVDIKAIKQAGEQHGYTLVSCEDAFPSSED